MSVTFEWRGRFESVEVNRLHAEGFGHPVRDEDWRAQVERWSLGWVCARQEGELVGWLNVPWDGCVHAFILDTLVAAGARRQGIGTALVALAVENARAAGCEWLHVDFDDDLALFYLEACGFRPTAAGLIEL
jgi:ribosomal protein S18 acetylase RimI-like enzyme